MWVLLHRYVGLVMALFLIVAGVTGSLLVWYIDLDRASWSVLQPVVPPTPHAEPLPVFELRERVLENIAGSHADFVVLNTEAAFPVAFNIDSTSDDEVYVDPYTGAELGRRKWGDITQGWKNVMPFIYRLHYSLALDTVGTYAFGIVALLWTLDCFIGAYLTLPRGRPFFRKWQPAWAVKRKRLNYDLHRAGGLWPWAMLFVLAWSSVALNLSEVYAPVTRAMFDYHDEWGALPDLSQPYPPAGLSVAQALQTGRILAAQEANRLGFTIARENWLWFVDWKGVYQYGISSDRDVDDNGGGTVIWFDADDGRLIQTVLPSGQHSGNTVTSWLVALHMAHVWGLPFRIFICVVGIVVAVLSVTGTIIWWRKLKGRRTRQKRRFTPAEKLAGAP